MDYFALRMGHRFLNPQYTYFMYLVIRRGDCAINAVYAVYYPSYVRSILHPAVATSSDALPTCLSKLILVHMKLLLSYLFRTY